MTMKRRAFLHSAGAAAFAASIAGASGAVANERPEAAGKRRSC